MSDMVTVKLDRRRPYRAKATDRRAVWVGPGEAEVPGWVAEAWGLQPQAETRQEGESKSQTDAAAQSGNDNRPKSPWDAYDTDSAADIIKRVPEMTATERKVVAAYERANKARSTVLDALEQAGA